MSGSNNIEIITFHHICSNPNLVTRIDPVIFKTLEIRILYKIIKEFHRKFAIMPNLKGMEQIREVSTENKEVQALSPAKKVEENIKDFLAVAEIILTHPIDGYTPTWRIRASEDYITLRHLESGIQTVVDWYMGIEVTPQNVRGLVSQAQSMFLNKTSISLYEEIAMNFWNPESHVQVQPADLIECGWPTLNKMLNGGFERKTLTHFWGAPNSGKTLFLGTLGRDVSVRGKNVFIGSLEMDTRKYAKRMGSSLFNIPINEYSKYTNAEFFNNKIQDSKKPDEFGRVPGALYVQRFTHASPTTVTLAADKLAKELGLSWDMVIYDYLGELESSQGYTLENMYAMHKTNNGEMFDHAVNYNWSAVTAHQVTADFFDAQDMNMKASAESRGISHRTDNIFGIIQDPIMFSAGKFFLKGLKMRDSEYKNYYMRLNIDWKLMSLTDDNFIVKPNEPLMV